MVEEPLRVLCAFILLRYVESSIELKLTKCVVALFIIVMRFFYILSYGVGNY